MEKNRVKKPYFCEKIFLNPLTNGLECVIIMTYRWYSIVFIDKNVEFVPAMPVFKGIVEEKSFFSRFSREMKNKKIKTRTARITEV